MAAKNMIQHQSTPPTPRQLSEKFVEVLRGWLTPEEWAEMCARNSQEGDEAICHSHDFCDANEAMDEAWTSFGMPHVDAEDEAQAELWREAWEIAFREQLGGLPRDEG